jgi:ribosomal-protein-alanine N-acetyltransferase
VIRGNKITLRTVRETDLDTLLTLMSDIANRGEYYPLHLRSEVVFKKRFHEHGFWSEEEYRFLICDSEDRILGTIWCSKDGYYDGYEMGYILFDPTSRGKGYTTEALSLFTKYLFATLSINRLKIAILPDNVASKRVAENCGFKPEGSARGAFFHKGRHHDVDEYSLLRGEIEGMF